MRHVKLAVLVTLVALWPMASTAGKKVCMMRSQMEIHLRDTLQQKPAGFTVSSPKGRLELWTTRPVETVPGIYQAATWTAISIQSKSCIEASGSSWIFVPGQWN